MNASHYERERKRLQKEIWSSFSVEKKAVIDLGIGEDAISTKTLIEKGAHVVTVDNNRESLLAHKGLNATFVQCDIKDIPFKPRTFDTAVFYFTLHEIDPAFHKHIISDMASVASQIVIVEPVPGGSALCQQFQQLWREAMHAVDNFEDYNPCEYWKALLETNGFTLVVSTTLEYKEEVPLEVIEDAAATSLEIFKEKGVPEKYGDEMRNLLECARKEGMKWSDIAVVIGKSL